MYGAKVQKIWKHAKKNAEKLHVTEKMNTFAGKQLT